ncbi:Cytoplasmic tRNA 2-thiolation protein 2 [Sesamum angolense]|uniref:Cytoplasmic tRNA 2-thiolation protein 2 n=1 Tax=Sesamum angolense TaxID=2727404 RepID=A0AAE1WFJ7_9LAMI|nr:Cytoplasmic tRNA 2-thiolation protein 2 [Sesamum angolense]
MSCNSGTCESGCYREEYSGDDVRHDRPLVTGNGQESNGVSSRGGDSNSPRLCIKCKVNENIVSTHPSVAAGGGDCIRFCADCFRSNLFGKFRFAVTSNAMISPSDNVLVALSGGPGSSGIDEMKLIVSSLAPPSKQFFVIPTESIYSPDCAAGRDQLTKLASAVSDVTGKEDLVEHLRMLSLQKIATENGCTKIVLGTCTSRIACHVLEATVKGQGFSLSADIQYVDARWEIPVVLPLRDCLSEELNTLCNLDRLKLLLHDGSFFYCQDSLKTIDVLQQPRSGINGLIASFVKLLQQENPSRESTIVRTAGKLTPFCFNRIPEVGDDNGHLASQRRQKKYNLKPNESLPPESFCIICNSPLKKTGSATFNDIDNGETRAAAACSSCQYQIFPKDPSSLEYLFTPPSVNECTGKGWQYQP